MEFSQIGSAHIGLYVVVDSVQVDSLERGKPFVDPRDYYDTQRTLVACTEKHGTTFLLETSAYATYRDQPLPEGSGSIQGIVSKTYNGSSLVLTLNDAVDAKLNGSLCQ